ncbi:hypothetical protein [Bacillus altitudinis]|uniref:hypothetical protein n=1 Tax=Bacillus altitudinis TaxID=293387 RepID=UPI0039BFA775
MKNKRGQWKMDRLKRAYIRNMIILIVILIAGIILFTHISNLEKNNEIRRYELVSDKLDEAKGSLYIEVYKDEDKSYKVWTNRGTYIIKFNDEYTKINQAVKIGNETKKSKAGENK